MLTTALEQGKNRVKKQTKPSIIDELVLVYFCVCIFISIVTSAS